MSTGDWFFGVVMAVVLAADWIRSWRESVEKRRLAEQFARAVEEAKRAAKLTDRARKLQRLASDPRSNPHEAATARALLKKMQGN